MPGRRSTILYRPSPSVTTVRAFSIRAGLAASTVTPGSTPPDVSLTTPAIPLACCAHVTDGNSTTQARATRLAPATLVHAFDIVPPSKVVTLPCASAYTPKSGVSARPARQRCRRPTHYRSGCRNRRRIVDRDLVDHRQNSSELNFAPTPTTITACWSCSSWSSAQSRWHSAAIGNWSWKTWRCGNNWRPSTERRDAACGHAIDSFGWLSREVGETGARHSLSCNRTPSSAGIATGFAAD